VTTGDTSNLAAAAGGVVTIDTNNGVVTVSDITTTGGAATANTDNGGAAAAITITTATNNVITLDSSTLTAVGGSSLGGTQGAGATITLNDPVALAVGAVAITTGATAGNIAFDQTLNGNQALTLTAGAGNITFTGIVGATTPLGLVTVNLAADVTTVAAFSSAGFNQAVTGTGTTQIGGLLTSTAAVTLAAATIDLNAGITTTTGAAAGLVTLNA